MVVGKHHSCAPRVPTWQSASSHMALHTLVPYMYYKDIEDTLELHPLQLTFVHVPKGLSTNRGFHVNPLGFSLDSHGSQVYS